mgnify:CR=1 FL=1
MSARPKLAPADQMTIEEFLAFAETRPNEERWELIEGVPVLNAAPVDHHQIIVANIIFALMLHKGTRGASWLPMPGIGTQVPVSPHSLPQPDIFVKEYPLTGRSETYDALVVFEVLSRSNTKADQAWRRRVYASVPNCQHYVTVSMKAAVVAAYDRTTGWNERQAVGTTTAIDLPTLDPKLSLADVYRYTPLGT